ncbi:hypothetical protein HK102_011250, partial [Quaeritorhiza haematococci]
MATTTATSPPSEEHIQVININDDNKPSSSSSPKNTLDTKVTDAPPSENGTTSNADGSSNEEGTNDTSGKKKKKKKGKDEPPPPRVPFSQLFRYATPLDFALMIIGTLSAFVVGVGLPVQSFIDYTRTQDRDALQTAANKVGLALAIIGGAVFVCSYLQNLCWTIAGENQVRRIRLKYFESIIRQDLGWFDGADAATGDLTARLTADISLIQDGISEKCGVVAQSIAGFLGGFIIAYWKSWQLSLVITGAVPIIVGAAAGISIILTKSTQAGQKAYGRAGAVAQQVFSSIRTVVAFGGEKREAERYVEYLTIAERIGFRKGLVQGIFTGVLGGFGTFIYALAFFYGAMLVNYGIITGGNIVNIFLSLFLGAIVLGNAGPGFASINTACGAAHKIFQVIDRPSKIDPLSPEGIKPTSPPRGQISFKNISFTYPQRPDVPVLTDFTLEVEPGQTVALVGGSGSGKSTIVKLIERFYDVNTGTILLDGVDIKSLNVGWLRGQIGFVTQEPVLFDTSIRQNLVYGLDEEAVGKLERKELDALLERACGMANAWDFIKKLPKGLDT